MEKYATLDNLDMTFKFTGIISSGLLAGGSICLARSHLPGMLAMTDMNQALMSFRFVWPRIRQMPIAGMVSIISGVGAYLVHRKVEDIPWLIGGVGLLLSGVYTVKVIYPNSIAPLLDPDLLKDNDEPYVRNKFKKFADYNDLRTVISTAAFFAFTFLLF